MAQESNLDFEFQSVATMPELLTTLEKHEADVGVAALSITSQRESRMDFSHPFYESGLQILTTDKGSRPLLGILAGLLKVDTLIVLGTLVAALVVNAHLLWFFERKRNPEMFPQSYFKGVWEAAWWSICSFVTGGCENMAADGRRGPPGGDGLDARGRLLVLVHHRDHRLDHDREHADQRHPQPQRPAREAGRHGGGKHLGIVPPRERDPGRNLPGPRSRLPGRCGGRSTPWSTTPRYVRYYLNTNPNSHLHLVEGLFDKVTASAFRTAARTAKR